jgi:lincosamide nucleotidyltransferase A/C/D/E
MMSAKGVLVAMQRLSEAGIQAWLDGGWGVDALLEEETREHDDLDIVVELGSSDGAQQALKDLGYEISVDERPTRLELKAPRNRQIDLRTVVFDEGGGGVQRLQDGRSYRYPPIGFTGRGKVAGLMLPCMTAEVQLQCHMGYEPTATDRHDVNLLVERFHLPSPPGY